MFIELNQYEHNLAHTDFKIYLDNVFSGAIRLWNEEVPAYQLFVAQWNARPENQQKKLANPVSKRLELEDIKL